VINFTSERPLVLHCNVSWEARTLQVWTETSNTANSNDSGGCDDIAMTAKVTLE
jgi:hypothetical protein